jgi:putative protease
MTKRYAPVISRSLEGFSRVPGRDKAPLPDFAVPSPKGKGRGERAGNEAGADFPEGFYALVGRIEDLYILQSSRPVKVMLPYSRKLVKRLCSGGSQPLPFPPRDIVLSLDPFFPQDQDAELAEDIPALLERGFTRFIINNPGHFSLFRGGKEREGALLVAGPWLYAFNAWAYAFIAGNGAEYWISPLENNRQNLERTCPREGRSPGRRSRVFITIFARPSLFRIRSDLSRIYHFKNFSGNRDEIFRLAASSEGTLVYPEKPFSLVDKTPFLREAGFSRFILDFSSAPLKKGEYRDIMEAVKEAAPLPGTGRFNWKNGFYQTEENGKARRPGKLAGQSGPSREAKK